MSHFFTLAQVQERAKALYDPLSRDIAKSMLRHGNVVVVDGREFTATPDAIGAAFCLITRAGELLAMISGQALPQELIEAAKGKVLAALLTVEDDPRPTAEGSGTIN